MKVSKDFFSSLDHTGYTGVIEDVSRAIENLSAAQKLLANALKSAGYEGVDKAFLARGDMTLGRIHDVSHEVIKIKNDLKKYEIDKED
jgi:hypothetical protein